MATVLDVNGINVIYDVNDSTEFDSITYIRTKDEIPVVPNIVKQTCGKMNDKRFDCDLTFYEANGKRWVKAADVVQAWEYSNPNQFVRESIPNEFKIIIGNRARGAVLLSIAGVYYAVFKSKMKIAEDYQRWVFTEVLPSIHATGKYDINESNSELANSVGVKEMDAITKHMMSNDKESLNIEQPQYTRQIDFDINEDVLSESAKTTRNELKLLFESINMFKSNIVGLSDEGCADVSYEVYSDTFKELGRRHKKEAIIEFIRTKGNVNKIGESYIPNMWGTPREVAEYISNCTARSCTVQELNKCLCDIYYQTEVKKGVYEPQAVAIANKCVTKMQNSTTLLWSKSAILVLWKTLHPHCMEKQTNKKRRSLI